jgi:hypothetical protein
LTEFNLVDIIGHICMFNMPATRKGGQISHHSNTL